MKEKCDSRSCKQNANQAPFDSIGGGRHVRNRLYTTQIGVKTAKMLYNIFLNGLKFAIFL